MSDFEQRIERFCKMVRSADQIACLTGAGMSTESGIPDFRSPTGVYSTLCSADVFSIERFAKNPADFYGVMAPIYVAMRDAEPNAGHLALARLEEKYGKDVRIATQNIDGLHQKAGSAQVAEVHGSMMTLTCQTCGASLPLSVFSDKLASGEVLRHSMSGSTCGGVMKPDIVFFGENLPSEAFLTATASFRRADLALVMGTSLAVYPAAGLPEQRPADADLVIINMTETPLDDEADIVFREKIGDVMNAMMECLAR